jgi:outer membrane lipoprotein-sorting protein
VVCLLLVAQATSAQSLLNDAWSQVDHAKSISVTVERGTEEFPPNTSTKFYWKAGGYFRAESKATVDVSSPQHGWTYSISKKIYQSRKPVPSDMTLSKVIGVDMFHAGLPVIGEPAPAVWHGRHTLRIELNGKKAVTKETKLFVFLDAKSHLPVGVSANLGSMTQLRIYTDLTIDPQIPDDVFNFKPPSGWKEVTPTTGGWN